jgi:hypothetical protein
MPEQAYRPDGFCPQCGYARSTGRCPECGVDVPAGELEDMHPRRQRTQRFIIAAAVIAVICALISPCVFFTGYFLIDDVKEYVNRIDFDAAAWKEPAEVQKNCRIRMVDDLLATHDLYGLTRQEVADLLGEPDDTSKFSNWDMVYWLGPERGFMALDSEWLVINFDDHRRVSAYRLAKD